MVEVKEKEKLVLRQKKINSAKMSKVDMDRRYAQWQIFMLNNLDIFATDFLGLKLHYFQRQILLDCWYNDEEDIVASRGLSKSFTIGIFAICIGLLCPGINILITSLTLGQSNKIIDEKIDVLLSGDKKGMSPILKQLREDEYIKFTKDKTGDGRIVEIGNGSKIFAVCCGEGGRANRSNIAITDEARLVKRRDYEAIIEPTLEPYSYKGLKLEPKEIFMTSARTKDNWFWTRLKKTVSSHYTNKDIKYGFFAGDIFTAVANDVQTKNQYKKRKENTNDLDFEMEFLNLWLGESENSLFSYEDFHKGQNNKNAFMPRTTLEFIDGCDLDWIFDDNNKVRYMAVDIAISGGRTNDNTCMIFGNVDVKTGRKSQEYITTKNGLNSVYQIVLMKRLFYEYKCKYIALDTKTVGGVIYDYLTIETHDEERNVTYPAWTICEDQNLQGSSSAVLSDKENRTISKDAEKVIICITGTSDINTQMHLGMRKSLQDETIDFLIDDEEAELFLEEKHKKWDMYSAEKRADYLMPFKETRFMINEAISLKANIKSNSVAVEEPRSATKDRYMTLAMFGFLGDKILTKEKKGNQRSGEVDMSDWSFLSGM